MIALQTVHARARATPSLIKDVTISWERGVLAVLGTPADGTTALLQVIAGATRVRAGSVLVEGRAPFSDAGARARVVYVPLETTLPDPLRVDEVCDLAGQIRGEPAQTAAARLAVLGLEALAKRRVGSLTPSEARAVSLAIAVTSKAPVILVEEPLSGLDPLAPSRVIEALRARAAGGAAVVVTTASVRDATRLGDQLALLTQGVFSHLPPSLAHVGDGGAKLRVVIASSGAGEISPFVAALAEESAVTSVETAAFTATRALHGAVAVVVSGRDLLTLARAAGAAAARSGANVLAIESAVMPLDAIRAAIAAPRPGLLPSQPPRAMPPAPPPSAPPPSGGGA